MSSIDERVVQMKFDNSQFQKGVSDTRGALDKLKQGLNLDASTNSLNGLDAAGKKFSLAGIAQGVSDLSSKFSAMSIIGITALTNIANKAVNAGMAFANSFTMAPIMEGFNEYELKMGSIQTILANTARHGTSLETVTAEFEKLNAYSDKTIYNFGDMTRNIGLFTASGIKVEDATTMIKGFSNAAATTGTSAEKASGAAYQLSQALGDGKITLETWNSLSNAGMGNKNMQDGLIKIADAMGTFTGKGTNATEATKSFNKSLEKGWLAPEVMSNYLKIMSGDMDDAAIAALGLSDAQVKAFRAEAQMGQDAATKVRTFTQLVGTLKESVGSSWATTFELLIGDFNKATDLFTNVNDTLGGMIGRVGNARNELLKGWADSGGRAKLIEGVSAAFNALVSIMKVVGAAWSSVFPPVTVDTLTMITDKLVGFLKGLQPGEATLNKFSRIFKGLFSILDIGWTTVMMLWGVFQRLFSGMGPASSGILEIAARFGDFLTTLAQTYKNSEKVHAFFVGLTPILRAPGVAINWLVEQFLKLWDALGRIDFSKFRVDTAGFSGAIDQLKSSMGKLKPTGETVAKIWEGLVNIFKKALEMGTALASKLTEAFSGVGKSMEGAAKGLDFHTILGMLGAGALAGIFLTVKKFLKNILGAVEEFGEGDGPLAAIKEAFGGLTDTLGQMQATLKASTLILIAGAIALMTLSVVQLAKVDAAKLPPVLAAITAMFVQLSGAMAILDKINITMSLSKMVAIGTGMILFAVAINILAKAVEKLGGMDWKSLFKGLVGVTTLIAGLAGAMALMPKNPTGMIGMGIGLIALAVAIKILASAVGDFAGMDWQKMMQGLIGVGIVLGGLALFTQFAKVNKGAVAQAGGLILLGVAIKIMGSAVSDFANMDPAKIQQGLGALTVVLAELAIFSRVVNPVGMVAMGVAMVILGGALKIIYSALADFATISWEEMGRGLVAMAGSLAIIAGAMWLMPPHMLVQAAALVVTAAALKILASALKDMGGMSWDEIGKGLLVLGASLLILAVGLTAMLVALPGAIALMVAVAALAMFVPVLAALGSMSWETIWTGIGAIALALGLLAVAGILILPAIPGLLLLGAAILLLGAGTALAGVGLLAFSIGLTALAAAGALGIAVLVAGVTALLGLIPYGMTQIGLGIVAFTKVIGENVPAFVEAAVKLLLGFIEGLRQVLPAVVTFIFDMLVLLLQTIANNVPLIVQAGFDILLGFLRGIADNIGQVVTAGVDIIVNFLQGIANNIHRIIDAGVDIIVKFLEGIGNNIHRVTDAGADLVIDTVNAIANTIETRSGEMRAAGERLAWAIADGLTGGMASKARNIAAEAWALGEKAIAAIKGAIDSNSPSKESRKLGSYLGEGFALGISDLGYLSERSGAKVGSSALEAMQKSISRAGTGLDGHMQLNPTIRPVLDLSAVKRDSGLIGGMIKSPSLNVDTTYAKATMLSSAEKANQTPTDVPVNANAGGEAKIEYKQYNYSPKALSPIEIYRNTRNQLSTVKGVRSVNA